MKSGLKITGLSVGIVVAAMLIMPAKGHAQAANTPPSPPAASVAGNYTYKAQPGDSLSLLVRKSIQLYDTERQDISLTPSGAMYAETNIVQKMGAPLLNEGQTVIIAKNEVANYCTLGTKLTPEQSAAWQPYAASADFNLSGINTIAGTAPAAVTPTKPATPPQTEPVTPPTNKPNDIPTKPNEDQQSSKPEEPKDTETKPVTNPTPETSKNNGDGDRLVSKNSAPWYWWLVGAGTLGILYYLLSGRQTEPRKK